MNKKNKKVSSLLILVCITVSVIPFYLFITPVTADAHVINYVSLQNFDFEESGGWQIKSGSGYYSSSYAYNRKRSFRASGPYGGTFKMEQVIDTANLALIKGQKILFSFMVKGNREYDSRFGYEYSEETRAEIYVKYISGYEQSPPPPPGDLPIVPGPFEFISDYDLQAVGDPIYKSEVFTGEWVAPNTNNWFLVRKAASIRSSAVEVRVRIVGKQGAIRCDNRYDPYIDFASMDIVAISNYETDSAVVGFDLVLNTITDHDDASYYQAYLSANLAVFTNPEFIFHGKTADYVFVRKVSIIVELVTVGDQKLSIEETYQENSKNYQVNPVDLQRKANRVIGGVSGAIDIGLSVLSFVGYIPNPVCKIAGIVFGTIDLAVKIVEISIPGFSVSEWIAGWFFDEDRYDGWAHTEDPSDPDIDVLAKWIYPKNERINHTANSIDIEFKFPKIRGENYRIRATYYTEIKAKRGIWQGTVAEIERVLWLDIGL